VASVVIPRNTTLPTRKINSFTTAEDNQTEITVRVYQGESALASKNGFVGQPRLAGITPAPSGTPGIDVCFDIDNGGNLRVSTTDKATQKKVEAVLESPYRLNPAQMKLLHRKVHKEIEAHVATENNRRTVAEESEVRAEGRRLSDTISKFLGEFGDQLSEGPKALLTSGKSVIEEYLMANASASDMVALFSSIDIRGRGIRPAETWAEFDCRITRFQIMAALDFRAAQQERLPFGSQ